MPIANTEQKIHTLKRYYLHYSYDLNDTPIAGIPEELLAQVKITNYPESITEDDIDNYIANKEKDTMSQEFEYWNSWSNDMTLIWDPSTQASPYMWSAKIYIGETFYDKLPTLTAGGEAYYPRSYNGNGLGTQRTPGDSRSCSSPTPKRPRTGATAEQ